MTTSAPLAGKPTFSAGRAFMTGNYANPTPIRALAPQSQSLGFKRKTEMLYGENQLAVAMGAGEMEVTGKVEFGKIAPRIFADLMFGDTTSTGSYAEADKEAGTVPASTPFTFAVANQATWLFDLGVVNASTGVIMTCVAGGSEVAGKSYSVSSGTYRFAAGDDGANVYISYAYSLATTGELLTMTQQLQGPATSFQATHILPWGTEQDMFVFYNCLASGSDISVKKSGFASFTLDFGIACNTAGQLGVATFAEPA